MLPLLQYLAVEGALPERVPKVQEQVLQGQEGQPEEVYGGFR